jgi:predicted membrane protein
MSLRLLSVIIAISIKGFLFYASNQYVTHYFPNTYNFANSSVSVDADVVDSNYMFARLVKFS